MVFLFYAHNSKQQLVHISQVIKNNQYYCPVCGQSMIIKNNKKTKYFAHKNKFLHKKIGESQIHQQGKELLAQWMTELGYTVQVEAYLGQINQRPDLLCHSRNRRNLILEYQCSPITPQKLWQRCYGYQKSGFNYYWFVGKRYCLKRMISQQTAQFFHYKKNLGFYYIYLNAEKQRLELYYQIHKADFLPLIYQIKYFYNLRTLRKFMQNYSGNFSHTLNSTLRRKQYKRFQTNCYKNKGPMFTLKTQCYLMKKDFQMITQKFFSAAYEEPIYRHGAFYKKVGEFLKLEDQDYFWDMPFVSF